MVDGDQYIQRVSSVVEQFQFARKALNALQDNPAEQAAVGNAAVSRFLKAFKEIVGKSGILKDKPTKPAAAMHGRVSSLDGTPDRPGSSDSSVTRVLGGIRDDAKADFFRRAEDARNRVNQNELILLVALLEMQMKDIHREVLRQDPSLMNAGRQVPLGKIIAEGSEAVIQHELEREVQSLDRKRIDERATYFQERLRLDWVDGKMVSSVQRVIELRNGLLHEDPDMQVSDDQLDEVRFVTLGLPFHCCKQCVERYPTGFNLWDGWLTHEFASADS